MKKITVKFVSLTSLSAVLCIMLTSCDIHLGSIHYDVPWWVAAVLSVAFLAVIIIVELYAFTEGRYKCTECGTEFFPKRYDFFVFLSPKEPSYRLLKCPCCKKARRCRRV